MVEVIICSARHKKSSLLFHCYSHFPALEHNPVLYLICHMNIHGYLISVSKSA